MRKNTVALMKTLDNSFKYDRLVEDIKDLEGEIIVGIEGRAYIIHPASISDIERISRGYIGD